MAPSTIKMFGDLNQTTELATNFFTTTEITQKDTSKKLEWPILSIVGFTSFISIIIITFALYLKKLCWKRFQQQRGKDEEESKPLGKGISEDEIPLTTFTNKISKDKEESKPLSEGISEAREALQKHAQRKEEKYEIAKEDLKKEEKNEKEGEEIIAIIHTKEEVQNEKRKKWKEKEEITKEEVEKEEKKESETEETAKEEVEKEDKTERETEEIAIKELEKEKKKESKTAEIAREEEEVGKGSETEEMAREELQKHAQRKEKEKYEIAQEDLKKEERNEKEEEEIIVVIHTKEEVQKEKQRKWKEKEEITREEVEKEEKKLSKTEEIAEEELKKEDKKESETEKNAKEEVEKEEKTESETGEIEDVEKQEKKESQTAEIAREEVEKEERKGSQTEEIAKEKEEKQEKKGTQTAEIATETFESKLRGSFCNWLKLRYKRITLVNLYLGELKVDHPSTEKKELILVVVIDNLNVIEEEAYEYDGKAYSIICKLWKSPPQEGVKVTSFEIDTKIDQKTLTNIEDCIRKRSPKLFEQHSNLEFISVSGFRSKKNGEEITYEPCIALFCSCKRVVPLNEEEFPKTIDNITTDVREGFFYQFSGFDVLKSSTDLLDPIRMGASISREDQPSAGTLGGFVTEVDSHDEIGFITASHVLIKATENFTMNPNFQIIQPSWGYGEPNVCGKHVKSFVPAGLFENHTIDASFVKITNRSRIPTRGLFAGMHETQLRDTGYSLQKLPEYDNGAVRDFRQEQRNRTNLCVKFGAVTGLTRGMLWINGMSARWTEGIFSLGEPTSSNKVNYFNQLQIIGLENLSFAQHGDSGALVFQVDSDIENDQRLVCIGMVVGGTSDNKTLVTPIVPILKALKLKMLTFCPSTMDESK